jgi:hypothetical protein
MGIVVGMLLALAMGAAIGWGFARGAPSPASAPAKTNLRSAASAAAAADWSRTSVSNVSPAEERERYTLVYECDGACGARLAIRDAFTRTLTPLRFRSLAELDVEGLPTEVSAEFRERATRQLLRLEARRHARA